MARAFSMQAWSGAQRLTNSCSRRSGSSIRKHRSAISAALSGESSFMGRLSGREPRRKEKGGRTRSAGGGGVRPLVVRHQLDLDELDPGQDVGGIKAEQRGDLPQGPPGKVVEKVGVGVPRPVPVDE